MILNQKAAVRCITNSRYNAHTGPLFKKLGILPFEKLVQFFQLKFMHQIRNNLAPRSFQNTWTFNLNKDILLRNENDFQVPPFRINIVKRFPRCNFPIVWNEFENPLIKEVLNPMPQWLLVVNLNNSSLKIYLILFDVKGCFVQFVACRLFKFSVFFPTKQFHLLRTSVC